MLKTMELSNGRPENLDGRSEREIAVYDMLDSLNIKYTRADHQRAETMEACAEIDRALGVTMCKNLFLCNRQKTDFYLLLMPGDKPFKTKDLSSQLGISRLSFADSEAMLTYLNILPGSVSVMGLMNDKEIKIQLLIDRDTLSQEYIGCHPCECTSSLKISTSDIINVFLPAVKHQYIAVDLPRYDV